MSFTISFVMYFCWFFLQFSWQLNIDLISYVCDFCVCFGLWDLELWLFALYGFFFWVDRMMGAVGFV